MTATEFIQRVKTAVREDVVAAELRMCRTPVVPHQVPELAEIAGWFQRLPEQDQKMVEAVIRLVADQSVWKFLHLLGNRLPADAGGGELDISHVRDGVRVRLNPPNEESLDDLWDATVQMWE